MNEQDMIKNVCCRCSSRDVEVHQENKIFTCKSCGKAEKAHQMKIEFSIPGADGAIESTVHRHLAREMAGMLSEQIGPHLAISMARAVDALGAKVPSDKAREIYSELAGNTFQMIFREVMPYLPDKLREELDGFNNKVIAIQRALIAEREAKHAELGKSLGVAGTGGGTQDAQPAPGDIGGTPSENAGDSGPGVEPKPTAG